MRSPVNKQSRCFKQLCCHINDTHMIVCGRIHRHACRCALWLETQRETPREALSHSGDGGCAEERRNRRHSIHFSSLCSTSLSFVRLLHTACKPAAGCLLPQCIRYPPRFRSRSSLISIFYTHECALKLKSKTHSHHLQHSSKPTTTERSR